MTTEKVNKVIELTKKRDKLLEDQEFFSSLEKSATILKHNPCCFKEGGYCPAVEKEPILSVTFELKEDSKTIRLGPAAWFRLIDYAKSVIACDLQDINNQLEEL